MSLRTVCSIALVAVLAACAVNPATGRRELSLISESQEIQMGRDADPQVTASIGLVEDPALQAYVADLGQRLAATSERPTLPWSFKVVDDPVVNAFAIPGGFIYVTRGILAHFDSEAELAGVLGHEIGHVTARHSVSQMSRQQLQTIGLGVGMVFSETVRDYGGLAVAGLQVMNLRYSRGDESQSDELGLRYITRAGYDADAMIGVFQMLAQVGGGGGGQGRIPEWQLTHPYPENREADIRERIAREGIRPGGTVARDAYLDRIDGLVYGEDPRQGFFQGARFVHPELEWSLTFPEGWNTVNQRALVGAVAPDETAILVLEAVEDGPTTIAKLQEFLRQEGVSGGQTREDGFGPVERARATFDLTTQEGALRGEVAFVRYQDVMYRVLGYSAASNWSRHSSAVASAISSFAAVTSPALLGVQPWRIDIATLPSAMSLNSYAERFPGPVDATVLGRLNRHDSGAVLSAGTRIKRVVGQPLP
ncbi:MAG: M48 family metalloprotease [Gemmatimonadota bacterium]|nr:M48 family metalloprotease [Gemmatimonadota bacterium]